MNTCQINTIDAPKPLFTSASELVKRDISVDYLVEDLIESKSSCMIFGPSGGGKSFTILDMGLSIATGASWAGKKTLKGLVIYFCGEGHSGIPRRIIAWQKNREMGNDDIKLFHVSEITIELTKTHRIIEEINRVSEYYAEPVRMIIIDTLSQHLLDDCDENSTKDMKRFLKTIEKIRRSYTKCASFLVHHTGHNAQDRARGASSLKGTLDVEILCKDGVLKFTKIKDGEAPDPQIIELRSVEIGKDKYSGKIITSAVVFYEKANFSNLKFHKLTDKVQAGIDALMELIPSSISVRNNFRINSAV